MLLVKCEFKATSSELLRVPTAAAVPATLKVKFEFSRYIADWSDARRVVD